MIRPAVGLGLLAALTGLVFGRLAWLHLQYLTTAAGPSFDTRHAGYDSAAAEDYLAQLSTTGLGIYTGSAAWLDTLFPVLLGLLLGALVWQATGHLNPWSRLVLLLVPAGYMLMDLAENALVQDMLAQGVAGLDPQTVLLASRFTMTKFVLLGASLALVAVLWLMRRRSGRRGAA